MTELSPEHVRPGLVLHLNFDDVPVTPRVAKASDHFFLCVETFQNRGLWWLLTSKPGIDRVPLDPRRQLGHGKWVVGTFYWHPADWFVFYYDVLVRAAEQDRSRYGHRNFYRPGPGTPTRALTPLNYKLEVDHARLSRVASR